MVFQEAGASHDEGAISQVVQSHGQALHDVGRKLRVLHHLNNIGIVYSDLVEIAVPLFVQAVQIVVMKELPHFIGRYVPGFWNLDFFE